MQIVIDQDESLSDNTVVKTESIWQEHFMTVNRILEQICNLLHQLW